MKKLGIKAPKINGTGNKVITFICSRCKFPFPVSRYGSVPAAKRACELHEKSCKRRPKIKLP